jgi:precorrin-2 dehydrogenase / sirohydrochlorin ferrochelatase
MHTRYYPMFVSLEGRTCLVIGGGAVGERKLKTLLEYGCTVRLIARSLTSWVQFECDQGRVRLVASDYEDAHLTGVNLVFAATNDETLNRRVAADARARNIWCNMASEPGLGSFILPSIVERGPLTIAISTAGLSPALAKIIREKLEKEFGPEWGFLLLFMGRLRGMIQARGLQSADNQRLYREIAHLPLTAWISGNHKNLAVEAIENICRPWLDADELERVWDELWKASSLCSSQSAIP